MTPNVFDVYSFLPINLSSLLELYYRGYLTSFDLFANLSPCKYSPFFPPGSVYDGRKLARNQPELAISHILWSIFLPGRIQRKKFFYITYTFTNTYISYNYISIASVLQSSEMIIETTNLLIFS